MRSIRLTPAVIASVLRGAVCIALLPILFGCGTDKVLEPERTWEEIRYHWNQRLGGESYGDLIVRDTGEIECVLQGQKASSRGLLAGENLETLARLIGALPPASYTGSRRCRDSFFITVCEDGGRRNYSTGSCDTDLPQSVRDLVEYLEVWVEDLTVGKPDVIAYRVLAEGETSGVSRETYRIAEDRDELRGLLNMLGANRPSFMPSVNFESETVVAIFLGDRASSGHAVTVSSVQRTERGQIVLSETRLEPGPQCRVETAATTPYSIVALATKIDEDLLIETEVQTQQCGLVGSN